MAVDVVACCSPEGSPRLARSKDMALGCWNFRYRFQRRAAFHFEGRLHEMLYVRVVVCSHTSRSLIAAASQKSINAAKGSHGTSSGELYERLRDYVVFQCSNLSKVRPLPPGLMKGVRFSFGGGIALFLQEALGYVLLFQQSVSQPLQLCEPILC